MRINKLDGGARFLIESEDLSQRLVLSLAELDELAEVISYRLSVAVARDGTGLIARTAGGKGLHLAFSDEVPEIVDWLHKEFAREFEAK